MASAISATSVRPRRWLLSQASQVMLSQLLRRGARFLFLFLVARKLGPETFGIYALLLAMLETLSLMTGEGLTDYVAREGAKSSTIFRALFLRVALIRCLLAVLLGPAAIAFLRALHYPLDVQLSGACLFLILMVRGPLAAVQGLARATHRMGFLIWLEAVQGGSVLLGFGAYLLVRPATLSAVVFAELSAAGTAGILALLHARSFWIQTTASPVAWRTVWKAAATFNIYPLITNIYDRIDIVILSVIAGNLAAGLYALPYRILATLQIIPFALMAAVLPILARRSPSPDDKQTCLRLATMLGVLAMFPALLLFLLAKSLVPLVLGASYLASAPVLQLLIWAAIPMFINFGLNTFLLAREKERLFLWTTGICAVANVTLNLLLVPRYSYYAAAAVTIVTECLLLTQNLVIIWKHFAFFALPRRLWVSVALLVLITAAAQLVISYTSPLIVASTACCAFICALYFSGALEEIFEYASPGRAAA